METKKIAELPVPTHIAKFVQRRLVKGVLVLNRRYHVLHSETQQCKSYFANLDPKHTILKVEMLSPNKRTLFCLKNELEQSFFDTMMVFVAAHFMAGMSARAAITQFLSLYDIDDEDYQLGTAYRYWTRHKAQAVLPMDQFGSFSRRQQNDQYHGNRKSAA